MAAGPSLDAWGQSVLWGPPHPTPLTGRDTPQGVVEVDFPTKELTFRRIIQCWIAGCPQYN
ncbi:hypothetical protein E2C01_040517 [Portunus trituberculatus]|uniref:Uncharacterized protein n=1 Tax=Portunus trituberculatus TaxID=210409 RepID=A0A5B7FHN8_PORTR|nr:hypothetical protein [Portunus trituberculatus]